MTGIAIVPPKPRAANDPSSASSAPTEAEKSVDAAQQSRLDLMFKADAAQDAMLDAMMKSARELELDDNWAGAKAMLEEVRSKDPYHFFLMSMLGVIAAHDGKLDEAVSDYEAELTRHPQHPSNVLVLLANAYVSQKRYIEAETLIRKYLSRNDSVLFVALANAQTRSGNDAEAVVTLNRASANHPNDGAIELPLALALHRLHRDREAAAVAKTVTIVAEDPSQVNGAAYALSEMKLELPAAEKGSRSAIAALELNSLRGTLQNANLRNFAQTNLLLASWDTLGWILFQEGNTADAEAYIRASLQGRFDVVVGDHLAQVLEKTGKSAEALDTYRMALAASNAALQPDVIGEVRRNIAKLERAGIHGVVADPAMTLQQMNTFRVPDQGDVNGDGTVRILANGQGIEDSRLESGPSQMQEIAADLTKLNFPRALPPASKARLFLKASLKCSSGLPSCTVKVFNPLQADSVHSRPVNPSQGPDDETEP